MSAFVDESQIHLRAGDGGAGCISFRREAHVSKGGPDGGDGGSGGDVWLVADRNVASLLGFKDHPFRRADNGAHGSGKKQHGRSGGDLIVPVPEGTVVLDRETGEVIADLVNEGDRYLGAEGGRGGKGNARFLSNRRRAPSFAEQGEVGTEVWLNLELKLMADVALVGFPNVGKSTLISRISAAKPKIADYPFTTLEPNLGVVRADDREYVVADIPGLIEGASEGKGLGFRFLRHIERARVLLLMLDLAGGADGTTTLSEQADVLLDELGTYDASLLDRPRLIVGSRADLAQSLGAADEAVLAELTPEERAELGDAEPHIADREVELVVSSMTGEGLPELVGRLADLVTGARDAEPERGDGFVVHRPVPEGVRVEREMDGSFRVIGRQAERAVALSDLTNPEALDYATNKLDRLGVYKALERAGVRDGEVVHVGRLSFTYEPDA